LAEREPCPCVVSLFFFVSINLPLILIINYNLRKRTKLYPLLGHGTGFSATLLLKDYAIVTVRPCRSTILNSQKVVLFSDPLQGVILRIIVFILEGLYSATTYVLSSSFNRHSTTYLFHYCK
jgi:hypothetical protein